MTDAFFAAELVKRRQVHRAPQLPPAPLAEGQAIQFVPGVGFFVHRGELVFGRTVDDPARFSTQLVMGCVGSPEASA
jgi:hypothetical protein